MKGLLVANNYIRTPSQFSQAQRIAEELQKQGAEVEVIKNENLAYIQNGTVCLKEPFDFCVFLDKDKSCARLLEKAGIPLFNSAEAIEVCDNKMLTHIALADHDILMPDSMYAPLCYYPNAEVSKTFLQDVAHKFGFPLVAKKCYGSLGMGVFLIKDAQELWDFEQENKLVEHLYQQYINCGHGEDIRVLVIGGKYICSMKRVNDHDFRSNVELGGHGERYEADKDLIALCEKVADILKLDYCGIDVLTDREGKRYICEVNSNAFFAEAERVCNVNIAKYYATHILQKLSK